ncbi:MAG TPA: arsenate reductase ArsC [Actinomycetes bacterium]|nr:arsenate reductase ArsC [Actinomycetes bacterium]
MSEQLSALGHPTVLVACRKNAGRSQAAAALLRHYAGDRVTVLSGGSEPADEVHPEVRQVLAERGLVPEEHPKRFDDAMVQAADVVVTMGCGEECPYYPGRTYLDWEVADPHGQPVETVRQIVDDIERRVLGLVAELGVGA